MRTESQRHEPVSRKKSPLLRILVILTAVVWIVFPILRLTLPPPWNGLVFKEGGLLETIPIVLYLLLAFLFFAGPYHLTKSKWVLGVICILFAAREFDIHERITDGNFLFFPENFKANNPGKYMVVEVTGVILVLTLVGYTCYKYWPIVRANLRYRDPHQFMMIGGLIMIGISVFTDGFRRKVIDLTGLDIGETANTALKGFEEATEALIPIYFLSGLMHYYKTREDSTERTSEKTSPKQ